MRPKERSGQKRGRRNCGQKRGLRQEGKKYPRLPPSPRSCYSSARPLSSTPSTLLSTLFLVHKRKSAVDEVDEETVDRSVDRSVDCAKRKREVPTPLLPARAAPATERPTIRSSARPLSSTPSTLLSTLFLVHQRSSTPTLFLVHKRSSRSTSGRIAVLYYLEG